MKISKVNTYLLQKKLSSSMCISRGGFKLRNHLIVEVETDEGIKGLGEGIGTAHFIKGIIDAKLGDLACGLDPRQIDEVRRQLTDNQVYFERAGSVICAASAIEMACWDIKAKALNQPLFELLGGVSREYISAYASDVYWEEDIGAMTKRAEKILDKGICAVKAHIGFKGPEEDTRRVQALRETVGKDTKLMIDLNAGYNFSQAAKACELWQKFNLFWLEEPLHPDEAVRHAELRKIGGMPIACGENEFKATGFKSLIEKSAVDVAMPDIGRVGGIKETLEVCALAQDLGIRVSPHNFSSGILLAATLHLMASTPNTELLEFDASDNAIYDELLVESIKLKNGAVYVPKSPGLGVHLPQSVIEKYRVA